jgi:hypothetical protein
VNEQPHGRLKQCGTEETEDHAHLGSVAHMKTGGAKCVRLTACGPGEEEERPPTLRSDRVCAPKPFK